MISVRGLYSAVGPPVASDPTAIQPAQAGLQPLLATGSARATALRHFAFPAV
jgi:hypothetical protein